MIHFSGNQDFRYQRGVNWTFLVVMVVSSIALGTVCAAAQIADQEQAAEAAEETPANPLGRLLEGLLKKPKGRLIPKPTPPQESREDSASTENSETPSASVRNFRDWVDRCAPHDYELEKMLEKVERNLELKAWKIAVEQLQQILDQPNRRISLGPGVSRLARDEIHRIISQLPQSARESYELQFGVVAREAIRETKEQGSLREVSEVVSRYLNTRAGLEAADYLATSHLDRGEWIAAALWYQRVLTLDPETDRDPLWYLKAATAFQHSGLDSMAERMLEEIEGLQSIQIAGRPRNVSELWGELTSVSHSSTNKVDEWRQFRATPTRSAIQAGEMPVLVPQWEMAATTSNFVRSQIRELTRDLRRGGKLVLPSVQPILTRNQLMVRTMSGVAVVELNPDNSQSAFRQVWETRHHFSPEQIVTGIVQTDENLFQESNTQRKISLISDYAGSNPEVHPLTGLLFRNGQYGLVSADEKRLYVPERQAWLSRYQPGYFSTRSTMESRDPLKREWSSNRLVAYDLDTGRVAWEIGGASFGDRFGLPLAGHYFFGAPLIADDSLYVVGEKENEIHLFCLEAENGHPQWSTLIGYSLHEPGVDLGRRWWTAQPALADGILVVPNTAGWLLGVDLATQSVIWETRFTKPTRLQNSNNQQAKEGLVESRGLDEQWHLSSPVIVGNHLFHTPRETDKLICLRLVDGDVVWEAPKGDLVSLIHADEQQLILATTSGLKCLNPEGGELLWEYQPPDQATLSGLPAVTATDLYAPWSDSSLTRISRADGTMIERSLQPPGAEPLGNLRFAGNYLISAGPLKTAIFELKSPFNRKLRARLDADPGDSWGMLQKAQLAQLEAKPEATLELVSAIDSQALSPHDREKQQQLIYQSLVTLIRDDLEQSSSYLERLREMPLSREQQREAFQLELARMVALGQYREAFDRYLAFAESSDLGLLIPEHPESRFRLQSSTLVRRGLSRILSECPPEVRVELNEEIESLMGDVDLDDSRDVNQWLLLFPDHPAVEKLRFMLARRAVSKRKLSVAEYHYRRLLGSSIRSHVEQAVLELDEVYRSFDRHAARRQLRVEWRDLFTSENTTTGEGSDSASATPTSVSPPDLADWGEFSLNLRLGALSYQIMNQYRYRMIGDPMPLLPDIRYSFNSSSERLQVHSTAKPQDLWSVPIRDSGMLSNRRRGLVKSLGHIMFVIQSNNITAISPIERRVLWNRSLQSNLKFLDQRSYSSYGSSIPALLSGEEFNTQYSAVNRQKTDPVIALSDDLICVRSQRELQAFHPLSGDLLWTIEKVSSGAQIISDGDVLYILNTSAEDLSWKVFLGDGRRVPLEEEQRDRLQQAVAIVGGDVITMESKTYRTLFLQKRTVAVIRRINLETGEAVWEWEHNGTALLGTTRGGIVILDQKQNSLSKLDFQTGEVESLVSLIGRLPRTITEAFLVESNRRLYLIANGQRENSFYRNYYLDSVPVNGQLIAIDSQQKNILWSQEVDHQHLVLELIEDSPVLLFLARTSQRVGNIYRSSQSVLALDQKNGRELIDYQAPYSYDFQAVHLNHEDQKISLMSYNSRMVLSAIPPLDEPLQAPKP
ncbi:MAG: PQQ-binding-like beta-propeller repeat protein [Planctomycetaceae bacterium]|nr:PQQ-binding-like beta-propeller repeat protein [Planctomycetaceae bacterium]